MSTDPTYARVPCHYKADTAISVSSPTYAEHFYMVLHSPGMQASLFIATADAVALRDAIDRVIAGRQAAIDAAHQLTLPEAA
jgi:hypothetical protein